MPDPLPPLGQIAIEWGLITREALAEAVDRQKAERARNRPRPLGEILVEGGYLSCEQVEELLLAQELAETRGCERLFGTVALERGYVDDEQVREALAEQSVAFRFGRKRPLLGEVFVRRGWMSLEQVLEVLEAQARGEQAPEGARAPDPVRREPPRIPGPGRRWAPFGLSVDDLVRLGRETGLHREPLRSNGSDAARPPSRSRPVTLAEVLEAGPLPPARAMELVREVARLLSLRDTRNRPVGRPLPQAILVTPPPQARMVAIDPPAEDAGPSPAPAELVHALGRLLYECLTGVPPRAQAPPGPSAIRPDIHPDVEAICMAALQGAEGPYPNPTGLADEIDRFLDGRRVIVGRRSPLRRAADRVRGMWGRRTWT